MGGTIYGEVKTVQLDAVIVKANEKEVVSPCMRTHVGPVNEGDQIIAFVTPGDTTTSIQPLDSRWIREPKCRNTVCFFEMETTIPPKYGKTRIAISLPNVTTWVIK